MSGGLTFTFVNNAFWRFHNQSFEEIIGRDIFQFVPSENKAQVKESLQSLTPEKSLHTHEHTNITGSGESRWIRWTNRALFDDNNRLVEYLCVGEDITEQKMAEDELRKSEKRYRIATSSPNLASVADLILKHHERWDGSGYPLGLKGKDIPVECRILAIVDAFVVMTNGRHYSEAKTINEALEELKSYAGSQFDPELVPIFIEVLDEIGLTWFPGILQNLFFNCCSYRQNQLLVLR